MTDAERAAPVSLGSPRFSTRVAGAFLVTDARFPAEHHVRRFTRQFRRRFGVTPAAYRAASRERDRA